MHLPHDFTDHSRDSFPESGSEADEDLTPDGLLNKHRETAPSYWRNFPWIHLVIHVFLSTAIGILSIRLFLIQKDHEKSCTQSQSIYSPVLDVLDDDYQTWKFNGTFRDYSPYKGPPNEDVDKAWADLFSFGAFRITPSHLEKIGGSSIAAQFPPEAGGGYLGFMEVLHQIHCVNSLWQYIYKDYYSNRSEIFKDSEEVLLDHLNHCADLLRQKLMCDADVGLIPMYWVKRHDHPYPDFSTYHKCRDFGAVQSWAQENQVDMGKNWKGYLEKPEGAAELEEPP